MSGNFSLDTTAHPTTNYVMFHGRTGTEYKLTATPVAITDPSDRATARALLKGSTKLVKET